LRPDIPELVSATTTRERRIFIIVVGVLNLLFLAVDVTTRFPNPVAVVVGRVAISLIFFWFSTRLEHPVPSRRLRPVVSVVVILVTGFFALLAWGAGGEAGPYLAFMPFIPLVMTVAIPDEPAAPLAAGLAGSAGALAMELSRGAPTGRIVLVLLAFVSTTLYGWAGTFLFRRMRIREWEAEKQRAEARGDLEDALRQSRRNEALYRAMAATFPDGVMALFDAELRTVLADGTAAAFSMPPSQLVGKRASDFLPPDVAARVEAAQRAALRGVPAVLALQSAGRAVSLSLHPVQDDTGSVILGLAIARDVTEHRALEARLATSARLAAMGTLVAGIAHEINNPLAGAMALHGFVAEGVARLRERLRRDEPLDRARLARGLVEAGEALDEALESEQRIAEIVKDLTLVGRPVVPGSRTSLARALETATRWVPQGLVRGGAIQVDAEASVEVVGSEGQLAQVIQNLLTNALRSVPEGRLPAVHVRIGVGPPGRAFVEVEDNGTGMGPELLERIFDPFFTTREVGQGTGLGLAICHSLVTAHGGTITVESEVGKGTTFRVELRAATPCLP